MPAFLDGKVKGLFIDGRSRPALSGKTFDSICPRNGERLAQVAQAGKEDIDLAVAAARRAFEGDWSRFKPFDRQQVMLKLADLVEQHYDELALLDTLDMGGPISRTTLGRRRAVALLRYYAGLATTLQGDTIPNSAPGDHLCYTLKEPVGVVAAINPWNGPIGLAIWKLCPVLATGCTVVLKPADETPLSVLKLAELVDEAGYPAGVFNVVTGTGLNAGAALSRHPGVDKLTFTGSTEVGKLIGKAAMDNMTRVTLELGGKSPTIVMPDANLQEAAAGAATAIFFNQGQVCCAGSRLYVHRKHFDNVVADIAGIANGMKLGNGLDPAVQMGPLISAKQQDRVTGYIELGRELGATIACGGEGFGPGYFVKPTVIVDVDQRHRLVQEEIFGPVLVAMPFDDIDEVIGMANDNPYGLGASIWSNDLAAVHRMIPRIKSGSVWVNCHSALDPALPFGGYKMSGVGREMGSAAIEHYTELKSVLIKL